MLTLPLHFAFSDELNIDYSKLVKNTAAEGLRVEDLVKKYFEAAEKVLRTPTCTPLRTYAHLKTETCVHRRCSCPS